MYDLKINKTLSTSLKSKNLCIFVATFLKNEQSMHTKINPEQT